MPVKCSRFDCDNRDDRSAAEIPFLGPEVGPDDWRRMPEWQGGGIYCCQDHTRVIPPQQQGPIIDKRRTS